MDGFETSLRAPLSTPRGLRQRAAEFLHVAATARDPVAWRELHHLAELYLQQAAELEAEAAPRTADNDNRQGRLRGAEGADTGG